MTPLELLFDAALATLLTTALWIGLVVKPAPTIIALLRALAEALPVARLPARLAEWLWASWAECALCGGFWVALAVYRTTGVGVAVRGDPIVAEIASALVVAMLSAAFVRWLNGPPHPQGIDEPE